MNKLLLYAIFLLGAPLSTSLFGAAVNAQAVTQSMPSKIVLPKLVIAKKTDTGSIVGITFPNGHTIVRETYNSPDDKATSFAFYYMDNPHNNKFFQKVLFTPKNDAHPDLYVSINRREIKGCGQKVIHEYPCEYTSTKIKQLIEAKKKEDKDYEDATEAQEAAITAIQEALEKAIETIEEQLSTEQTITQTKDALVDAQKALNDAEETLEELYDKPGKEKELRNTLDKREKALKKAQEAIEQLKTALKVVTRPTETTVQAIKDLEETIEKFEQAMEIVEGTEEAKDNATDEQKKAEAYLKEAMAPAKEIFINLQKTFNPALQQIRTSHKQATRTQ